MPLWKPTDVNDVHLWLKSEDITGSTSWTDSSGKGNTMSHTAPPSVSATLKNSKKMAAFNGTSQYLKLIDGGVQPTDVGSGEFFIGIFVKMPSSISSTVSLFAKDANASEFDFRFNGSRELIMSMEGGTGSAGTNTSVIKHETGTIPNASEYYFLFVKRSGTTVTVGHSDSANSNNTTSATNDNDIDANVECYLGARESTGGVVEKFWNGEIGEIFIIHNDPTDTDHDAFEGYLAFKFDQDRLEAAHPYKFGPPTSCHCVAGATLGTDFLASTHGDAYEVGQELNIRDERG